MDRNTGNTGSVEVDVDSSDVGSSNAIQKKGRGPGRGPMVIDVEPLKLLSVKVTLVGETPLLMNNFNQRGVGLTEMRNRMLGIPAPKKTNRAPKDPVRSFRDALYALSAIPKTKGTMKDWLAGKKVTAYGKFFIPFSMLKGCIETAATDVDGASKAGVKRAVRIVETWAELKHKAPPYMVEHVVRLPNGAPDLRYRAQFDDWEVTFTTQMNSAVLSVPKLVNLFNVAGFAAGLGDWRPEKGGEFGRFHVKGGRSHTGE